MKDLTVWVLLLVCSAGLAMEGQVAAETPKPVMAATEKKARKTASESPAPEKKAKKTAGEKDQKTSAADLFGQSAAGLQSNEPLTTEIYADEAFFDSTKNMGIFSGRVKVTDPRFNLQSDKLTVFITKGENQSLEKAIAEGNVGLVRERPDPKGGPPTRAVGRAEKATYTAATGDVELRGTPRVQEGENMHVATSADTVMIINQNSQLRTHGPSRTEIRQRPDEEKKAAATPAQTAAPQVSPASALPTP
jgi:lipopolysaccharide transport protein LptA